ncbi:MAG: ATP-binding protein [Bacteroidota bacterium]
MTPKIELLAEMIRNLSSWGDFMQEREIILDELKKINAEQEKLIFKSQRSIKEKNILSSLLTRTTFDLKQASSRLSVRAEELSTLLTTIPAYVFFKDIQLNYLIVNQAFADLVGIPEREIIGKSAGEFFGIHNSNDYFEKETQVIRFGIAYYDIEERIERNQRAFWVSTNIAPIRNADNEIVGLIGISWDITERKQHEEELRHAKELAEAGTMAKNEFIASVSHEFRTPMAGILGLSEILKITTLNHEQLDLLKGIISSAENLLVLLNDVLDFSAMEAGQMKLDYQPFIVERMLQDIYTVMNLKAEEKFLGFEITTRPDVPKVVIGDAQRVRQILLNLANNAVKFTEKGRVSIVVSPVETGAGKTLLRFEVADSGIGIPDEAKKSLFKVFSRVKQDNTKLVSGTGLGLSICRKLTDLMGGEIGVETTVGKGSKFWFTLPFNLPSPVTEKADTPSVANPQPYAGLHVLVAEDNPINLRIVDFQLRKMGFIADLVVNGKEAIEKYAIRPYNLIILDIQMPIMDGYQVAKKIRETERNSGGHIPIIALTANAMKGDREQYLAAGMDEYVSKPFTHETLLKAISNLLG